MADDLHLIIANKAYSSWSMRPWIAMKAQGLDFRETVIGLDQPDTAARIKTFSAEYLAEAFPGRTGGRRTAQRARWRVPFLPKCIPGSRTCARACP